MRNRNGVMLSPFPFEPPMRTAGDLRVIIDTREQRPYRLAGAVRRCLSTGDYSIAGYEDCIAVERKSLADLLSCIGRDRARFERELARLACLKFPALVIEADLSAVLAGNGRSLVHPSAVLGSLVGWSLKYRLPVWFAGNRRIARLLIERLLAKAAEYAKGD
jgi:DNA excision repair protein ERCC-4